MSKVNMESPEVYSLAGRTGDSKSSREQVYQAMALIELFEALQEDFSAMVAALPKIAPIKKENYKSFIDELETFEQRIRSLVATLDTDVVPLPSISEVINNKVSGNRYQSKIERLGIGGEILRLRREQNMSIAQIAERFNGVSENLIRRYFRIFDHAKPTEQVKMRRSSMQDIFARIEDLAAIITRGMARLEGMEDDVHVKYVGEYRQLIDTTAKVTNQMLNQLVNYKRYEELVKTISTILQEELPERRLEIMKKISVHMPSKNGGLSIGSAHDTD